MDEKFWFQKSLHRLLVDMHIPDWNEEMLRDFSPENYAEMMRLAKVDTAEIYAGSCLGLCYWPTKVGFPHRCLHGRDLLGETIEACRKRGIQVQIYLNVWSRAAYDAHPEWRLVKADGRGTVEYYPSRFGLCCPNTGFGQYFLDLLDELNSRYECPGFWIDMIGNYHHCYCPACRERFRRETPFSEIPQTADWNDPAWLAFDGCRSGWLNEFAEKIYAVVKKRTPDRTVTLQTASILRGREGGIRDAFLNSSDFLAGDFVGGRIEQSYICKYFSSLSKHRPMEFMTPRCENLNHHTTGRSYENLLMRSYAAIANQASFTLIDAIDPRGTLDRRFYETAGKINDSYARYQKYIDGGSEPCFDIGIYVSPDSQADMDKPPRPVLEADDDHDWSWHRDNLAIADTLQKNHLLFSFVRGCHPAELAKAPMILLSNCSSLTGEECAALETYVRNGGKLYASYQTSLYDPAKGRRAEFRLADLFGIRYAGEKIAPPTYIAPVFDDAVPGITARYPLTLEGPQLKIAAAPDAEVLGTLTLPISDAKETVRFGSAISNPPMIETDSPALVRHRYGRGEVLYAAGQPETVSLDFHRSVMGSLWKRLLGGPQTIETNAPACVECTLFDQRDRRRLVLSCLNLPAELPALPLYGLSFRVRLPEGMSVKALKRGPDDADCPFVCADGVLEIRLEKLEEFALFTIQY